MTTIKKVTAVCAALALALMCFSGISGFAAGGLSVSVSASGYPEESGQETVTVKLDSLPSVGSADYITCVRFKLRYDPQVVTFPSGSGFSVSPDSTTFPTTVEDQLILIPNGVPGTIEFCYVDWATVESIVKGSGTKKTRFKAGQSVTLAFTLNSGAGGSDIEFEVYDVCYGLNSDITAGLIEGSGSTLKLSAPNATVRGDLTGEGNVTSDDAVYLLRYTLFPAAYPIDDPVANADFTGEGPVTSDDAVYLLRYTLFPEAYPIE